MKKISTKFSLLLLTSAVIYSGQLNAQSGCSWAKKAGGTNEDMGTSVATDPSGNVYSLGNFYSASVVIGATTLQNQPALASNYGAEMFLAKYDSCGNFQWAKRAGGNAETDGMAVTTDVSGNIYVVGHFTCDTVTFGTLQLFRSSYYDVFLVKYDPNGNALWARQGKGNDVDKAYAVSTDPAGNVYITGNFYSSSIAFGNDSVKNSTSTSNSDIFVAKFDGSGNIQWVTNGRGASNDAGYGISNDAAGNVYVTGYFSSPYIRFGTDSLPLAGFNDIYLVKLNTSGTEQWLRTAGSTDDDRGNAVATDAAGNSYVTGFIGYNSTVSFGIHPITNTNSSLTMFIAKYDVNGMAQWANKAQGQGFTNNPGYNVKLDAAGNPHIIGYYNADSLKLGPLTIYNKTPGGTEYDIFVAKYKSNGYLSWTRSFGGDSVDFGYGIATGPHNAVYICGEYRSPSISFPGGVLTSANSMGDAFLANNISQSSLTPDICLVTTDSTSTNNVIYWDKTPFTTVDSFIVFREVTSGVYKRIGSQKYNVLSQFTDIARSVGPANGDPNVGTYRYKIQTIDTSGCYGKMSPYHNTVYFTGNGSGTFNWNVYSVENATITPVSQFNLLRDNNNTGNWQVIGTVAGTQTTLNDASYSTYSLTANWRVEALGFSCTPTSRYGNNSTLGAVVKSKSNITNNRGFGISGHSANSFVNVYPNPANNSITLISTKELGSIAIYNALGEQVYAEKTNESEKQLDISKLSPGVYTLFLQNQYTKLIKE